MSDSRRWRKSLARYQLPLGRFESKTFCDSVSIKVLQKSQLIESTIGLHENGTEITASDGMRHESSAPELEEKDI
jgi:hypothetical protein